jgi:hypothetical protein
MKNINPVYRALFLFTFILLSFTLISCEEETDDTATRLTGTWHQTSYTIDGQVKAKDSTRMLMQINSDQICILCDSSKLAVSTQKVVRRSGWSYSGGLFNLAVDLPVSWKPTATEQQLTLEKTEFSANGDIIKSTLVYRRIAPITID